ncbi:MAG: HEAT repeat domain-containing protein [Myxococcales bacterium]|nr:HEAT repeat domain-containing protein [Myxococcales bacterium]
MTPAALLRFVLLAAVVGCGNAPPVVPDAAPVGAECQHLEPPPGEGPAAPAGLGGLLPAPEATAAPDAAPKRTLRDLRPDRPPQPGTPLHLPQLLAMHHPPSDMQWRALPPTADAGLIAVIDDPAEAVTDRARAMDGLAVRHPAGGHAPLAAVLADGKADGTLRRSAARALARGFGGEPAARAALFTALDDDDAMLREAVVKALADQATDAEVRAALQARRDREQAPLVREALDAALSGPP